MKREWRRPSAARPWLLLRPGLDAGPWDWLLVEAGGARREGEGRPPADLQAQVALIVPGASCSHFQLPAPPGLKREEWPLLLEDRLLQGPEQVLCACLERRSGELRLVCVDRELMGKWQAVCAGWGVPVERCWAEFQLLPEPANGEAWQWRRDDGGALLRGRGEDGREHWLAWPAMLGDQRPAPWTGLRLEPLQGCWPSRLAVLDGLPALFEASRTRRRSGVPPGHARLGVACVLLATLWGGLWLTQQWRQAQLYRSQVLAVTGDQASPRQAAQALKRLRDETQDQQLHLRKLDGLQAQLQDWLGQNPEWRLHAVRFDGQRWQLGLSGEGQSPPWQAMASAADAKVQVQPGAQPAQWQVVFDLGGAT
ncbi:MAG TPA: GspL/Epsl periplasmic domain-containing protein [Pseudomonas sp.]|uniref:GspL/Epsl periplasmic domain-containing protein n=1 Tax=Pseudomonas sp. TaxID=306 RepID=UPI002B47DDE1|nr:GspL/Epsl periplasmic domain-containing protein [Pseudomonas sp.]HKS12498.1 GspL/Epsl periplasmic domain-containing protein [Pseudomonas sp.]